MFLLCHLLGHTYHRHSGPTTEVTWLHCTPMLTRHESSTTYYACCQRCGKVNPNFSEAVRLREQMAASQRQEQGMGGTL